MIEQNKGDIDSPVKRYQAGRTKISDSRRTRSFSQRTSLGKLSIIDRGEGFICKNCGHEKALVSNAASHRFGIKKCSRCKVDNK